MLELRRILALVMILGAGGLAFSACGGGSEPEPVVEIEAPAEPVGLTEAELIAKGDNVCREVNAAVAAIRSNSAISANDQAAQVGQLYSSLADRLSSLGTPTDGAAPSDVIDALKELAQDPGSDTAQTDFTEASADYGLLECAGQGAERPDIGDGDTGSESNGTTGSSEAPAAAPSAPAGETGGVTQAQPNPEPAPTAPSGGGSGGSSGGAGTGGIAGP